MALLAYGGVYSMQNPDHPRSCKILLWFTVSGRACQSKTSIIRKKGLSDHNPASLRTLHGIPLLLRVTTICPFHRRYSNYSRPPPRPLTLYQGSELLQDESRIGGGTSTLRLPEGFVSYILFGQRHPSSSFLPLYLSVEGAPAS